MNSKPGQGSMGAGGACICLACGHREPHRAGTPCREQRCAKCGKALVREGSEHHQDFLEKQKKRGTKT
jgi:hypothetical protein